MAIVSVPIFSYPGSNPVTHAWQYGTATTLDANGEKYAYVFAAPKDGTIDRVGFRTATVTTGDTMDVRLETVDASGNPSGTLATVNSNGSQVIANTDDDTWFLVTLTAGHVATRGEILAVVVVNGAAPGVMNIANLDSASAGGNANLGGGFPYQTDNVGAWSKGNREVIVGAVGYSDGSYEVIENIIPAKAEGQEAYDTLDPNDEMGIIFTLPFPCRVVGVRMIADMNGDTTMKFYDTDGSTVLASTSLDKDQQMTSINHGERTYMFADDPGISVSKDSAYRISFLALSTSLTMVFQFFDVDVAAQMDMFPGGANIHKTHRNAGGAWTQTTTRRPLINILIDGLDDGASGGGGGGLAKLVSAGGGLVG